LDPALHLAHRIQIVVDHRLVRGAERALQVRGVVLDQVEDALALVDDLVTLRRIVALAEQAIENLARVVLHRQRLRGSAERNGPGVTATEARVAGAAAAFTGELQRRQRRVLADLQGRHLIAGDAAVRGLAHGRVHTAEPRACNDGVGAGALTGLVAQAADDGEVL